MADIDFKFLSRAVLNYAKKLESTQLEESDNAPLRHISFIRKDLDEAAEKAMELGRVLGSVQTTNTVKDERPKIDSAVKSYLKDLETTKEALIKKLESNSIDYYSLDNLNEEISKAREWLN